MAVQQVGNGEFTKGTLQRIKRAVWNRLNGWDFFVELCQEMMFGEIRIIVHEGKMKDLHIDLHVREDK